MRALQFIILLALGFAAISINLAYTQSSGGGYTNSSQQTLAGYISISASASTLAGSNSTLLFISTAAAYGVPPYTESLYVRGPGSSSWVELKSLIGPGGEVENPATISVNISNLANQGYGGTGEYYFKVVLYDTTGRNLTSNTAAIYMYYTGYSTSLYSTTVPYNSYSTTTVPTTSPLSGYITVSPSYDNVAEGSRATFITNGSISGGTAPYNWEWYLTNSDGDVIESDNTNGPWTVYTNSTSTPPGTYYIYFIATDSKGSTVISNHATLSVNYSAATTTISSGALSGYVSVSPSESTLSPGQGEFLNVTGSVSGGAQPYSYGWYRSGVVRNWERIATVNGNLYVSDNRTTPTTPGVYYYQFVVTDHNGQNLTSNAATVYIVNQSSASTTVPYYHNTTTITSSGPLSGSITISPSVVDLAIGGASATISLGGSVNGGTPPYTYGWYITDVNGNVTSSDISNQNGPITIDAPYGSTPGTYYLYFILNDSRGSSIISNRITIIVSSPTAGTGASGCVGCSNSTTVPYTTTVQYNENLSGTIYVNPTSASLGIGNGQTDTIDVSGDVSGGTAPYYYSWLINNPGTDNWSPFYSTNGDVTIVAPAGTTPGYYGFKFQLTDSTGAYITSSPTYVDVYNAS